MESSLPTRRRPVLGRRLRTRYPVFLLVALTASILTVLPTPASAEERPNILMILTDDQRAKGSFETMPNVRRLGTEGAIFDNAYATTPFCCPSRASILTGLYTHNHPAKGGDLTDAEYSTVNNNSFVQDFDAAGYQTAFYGKYLNGWPTGIAPAGFDDWAIMPTVYDWYNGMPWNVNGVEESQDGTYSTHFIRDHALSFLAGTEGEDAGPWMMMLHTITPHSPATPEPAYEDLTVSDFTPRIEQDRRDKPAWVRHKTPVTVGKVIYQRTNMLRALKSIDDMLGALRQQLVATGEENTVIIFAADNGLQWGEHGLMGKTTPYIPSVRVPLYVSWPGQIAPGHRANLVGLLDLAPTLLGLTDVPSARIFDGRSLFGPARSQLLLEFWSWPGFYVPTWKAFLTPTMQYIEYYTLDGSYLTHEAYDMVNDRKQLRNLYRDGAPGNEPPSGSHRRLRRLATCDGAACP
jgi:arylsulfatase A-like enzyme